MTRSLRRTLRTLAAVGSLAALAACNESSPTGIVETDAALSRGSSGGSTANRVEIVLTRPAGAVFANAKGKAKFASKTGERELQIEVENIPAGTTLNFFVDGVQVGSATASALREANLNLNSQRGDAVPLTVTGKSVSVRTAAGVVVSGSF